MSTLQTLEASAPIGLAFVDQDFRFVHANEMLASFSHSTVSELVGRTVEQVVPDIWSQVEPIYRRVLMYGESVQNIEVTSESITEPGRRQSWLANYYPVKLLDETIGVGMVVIDVTERRHADQVRAVAMRQLAEGVYTVDSLGCLTSMNEAAARMLGWSESELMNRRMRDFVLVGDEGGSGVTRGDRELLRVRHEGVSVRLESHAYRTKDGSILPVSVSASPLIIGDLVEGVVVFRDITEEKSERIRIKRELDALTWVGRIREALDEDRMVLHTQPIVPLFDGRPSEELLIRMTGRDNELILPGSFLPVAEKYGLITEIDQWVLKQAINRAAQGIHVGANVSAESIVSFDLLSLIAHELKTTGADPGNLVFEITETALVGPWREGRGVRRSRCRDRMPRCAGRLRHRLRRIHLPQAASDRLPEDRHRVRPGPRHQTRPTARRRGDREARSGVRLQDDGRRRGGPADAGVLLHELEVDYRPGLPARAPWTDLTFAVPRTTLMPMAM